MDPVHCRAESKPAQLSRAKDFPPTPGKTDPSLSASTLGLTVEGEDLAAKGRAQTSQQPDRGLAGELEDPPSRDFLPGVMSGSLAFPPALFSFFSNGEKKPKSGLQGLALKENGLG